MSPKSILIVDDEEPILSVLKSSLKKLGPEYGATTVSSGQVALDLLREQPFDLVVTDYRMAGMNGLELLEALHSVRPQTRVILMTAYSSPALEKEANKLHAYRYLTKPLEIDTFRQVVMEALSEDEKTPPSGVLVLSDDRYRQINRMLLDLERTVSARCIFLTDAEGRFIARTGNTDRLPLEQIASLVGGGIATLLEAGRVIDGDADTVNLAYREGQRENLYVINIGRQLLLIVITEHGPYGSRLGTVWYYARQAALQLKDEIGKMDYTSVEELLGSQAGEAIDKELDLLWAEEPSRPRPPVPAPATETGPKGNIPAPEENVPLLSFDQAVEAGLIIQDRADGLGPVE